MKLVIAFSIFAAIRHEAKGNAFSNFTQSTNSESVFEERYNDFLRSRL